ncbi:MAG: hypothetical protein SGJ18_07590 [Pseudomonadota bacterium]|nr:hypothetical protein [Pseudomonadota bacterium]
MKALLVTILIFGMNAYAGIFSSEPPKEFLALKVTSVTSYREHVTYAIQEFIDVLKMDDANQISWEKASDTVWALKVKRKDKMTDVTTKLAWEFAKREKGAAVLKRMSADDVVLNSEFEIMNGFQTWATVIDAVQKKAGKGEVEAGTKVAKASPKKSLKASSGAVKAVAKTPEPENLSKGMKGSYVQEYTEDANSSAFSIEETSPGSIRLVANAPISCEATLNLKRNFAGQIYANAADNPGLYFEISNNNGEVKLLAQIRSSCKGPCCDLKKHYLRQ